MLEPSGAELDQTLFQKDKQRQLGLLIDFAATLLEQSNEVVHAHDSFDADAARLGVVNEIEEEGGEVAEMFEELSGVLGEGFMADFITEAELNAMPPVSDEEYREACSKRDEAQITLTDYTLGYHDYMKRNLVGAYGEDNEDVDEEAWTVTWKKLKEILGKSEGTALAEAASFFDGLVRQKYGPQYKPMETTRGPEVSADICARTFFVIMEDHLHRAIIGANRDEWTGYQ